MHLAWDRGKYLNCESTNRRNAKIHAEIPLTRDRGDPFETSCLTSGWISCEETNLRPQDLVTWPNEKHLLNIGTLRDLCGDTSMVDVRQIHRGGGAARGALRRKSFRSG